MREVATGKAAASGVAIPTQEGSDGSADPLTREIGFLDDLLDEVIVEQSGRELLEGIAEVRSRAGKKTAAARLQTAGPDEIGGAIRAFGLFFQLANLAEQRERLRTIRRRQRRAGEAFIRDSLGEAVQRLADAGRTSGEVEETVRRLFVSPVLTAHPTEARRRTLLVALRRFARLLERRDDRTLSPPEDRELRRRLREELTILWRTADLRSVGPTPLDEVRTALVFFDETLFGVIPTLYRGLDAAFDQLPVDHDRESADRPTGTRPPRVGAFLRWGTWIGGDRDGNPNVTASVTLLTARVIAFLPTRSSRWINSTSRPPRALLRH